MTLRLPANLLNADSRHMASISEEVAKLEAEANELAAKTYLVATNQGTYSASEACRKVGTGDPRFADRNVYETVGGTVRTEGPHHDDAPGMVYYFSDAKQALKADREKLAELRKEISRLNGIHKQIARQLGWR